MNYCEAHKSHKTKMCKTRYGLMKVYDYPKYKDAEMYCSGKDDVSRTLLNQGVWEAPETEVVTDVLVKGERNLFLDIGSHIGWYSLLAKHLNYPVISVDADKENLKLLEHNLRLHNFEPNTIHAWVDHDTTLDIPLQSIELLKADIEGNETFIISNLKQHFEQGLIKHLFLEISPVFNQGYPQFVERLKSYGYKVDPRTPLDWDIPQSNVLFTL